ncbi:MAG: hypothetical protein HFG64_04300 [Lachnospiraceae bacterium]|nr:hypothetical protein [Lachnospiraceae bacterium]
MKKHMLVNLLILAILLMTAACSSDSGTAPVITVGSSELTLGDFRPSTLSTEDFEIGVPGGGLPIGNMPGNSWMSGFLTATKDHHSYAYLYIYNPKKEEVPYIGATVYKIDLNMDKDDTSFWSDDSILINGINFYGMDAEGVKTAMANYKLNSDSETYLYYKDGKYGYSFSIGDDGTVEKVSLEMQIPKSYSSK